jgi:hypothetical protein
MRVGRTNSVGEWVKGVKIPVPSAKTAEFRVGDRIKTPFRLSAALGIVRVDRTRLEYLLLGDVTIVVGTGQSVHVLRDERVASFDRAAVEVLRAELARGTPYARARVNLRSRFYATTGNT